jgi:hypothetical protein
MAPGRALLIAIVIVLVVLIAAAFLWYHFTGWSAPFTFESTQYPEPTPCAGECPASGSSPFPCVVGSPCCVAAGKGAPGSCYSVTPCLSAGDCPAGWACGVGYCVPVAPPSWSSAAAGSSRRGIDRLRFKGAVFTVTDPAGTVHTRDVTPVLNAMATAYRGAPGTIPQTLSLDRPLNAFSFVVPGVNDNVAAADLPQWAGAAVRLTGRVRVI